ncbi:MAG: hypothetical protein JSV26_04000 [bacterium]|nr:MAG: hypothetical protein JSV26_04000 [bacterium]
MPALTEQMTGNAGKAKLNLDGTGGRKAAFFLPVGFLSARSGLSRPSIPTGFR